MRCLLAGLVLAVPVFASPSFAANAIVTQTIDGFVRPAYVELHRSTNALSRETDELCAEPSQHLLDNARAGFASLVRSWSDVEIIRFGPITEANRLERFMFWPDRKSIGLKQVQGAIAGKDPTAADPAQLPGKSIAMQGIGALEYVLFGTGADDLATPAGAYRCSYAAAITANLDVMASDVAEAWQSEDGFARIWANPAADNPNYHTDDEALTEVLDTLIQGLEMLRDVRINGFLAKASDADKPKQAIFWRSEATILSLVGNLNGLKALLAASDLKTGRPEAAWIVESADAQLANGIATLSPLEGPIDAILSDPAKREKLSFARDVTSSLSATVGTRLTGELGLTAGFSSLDGD